ncbi:MAG: short-chain dehydrogenase [Moraxellaceae bacterium]|nr:MAG: short-chain dehydrogenase [Moraxellaceae bacterium]
MASPWSTKDIPSQENKIALITGANSGIGFEAAKALAEKGALVVLACRNEEKAKAAIAAIKSEIPSAKLEFLSLDLASQASVKIAAKEFLTNHNTLDLLINNAGVMWLPKSETMDGHDMQFGTNHLGHFTLTGLLLDTVVNTPNSRIVTVSSMAHYSGRIHFDDIKMDGRYGKHKAYAQAKLANLMFAYELDRKLSAAGIDTRSIAVHPGMSSTNLGKPGFEKGASLITLAAKLFFPIATQSARNGALPTLYGATANAAAGGDYIGPSWIFEIAGPPKKVGSSRYSKRQDIATQLWQLSEKLTGTQVAHNFCG